VGPRDPLTDPTADAPSGALSLTEAHMRELGYRVVDLVVDHLAGIRDEPAVRRGRRSDLEGVLREPIPESGSDPGEVLDRVVREILPWTARVDHPRFFAHLKRLIALDVEHQLQRMGEKREFLRPPRS
jgi:hypothetical protein